MEQGLWPILQPGGDPFIFTMCGHCNETSGVRMMFLFTSAAAQFANVSPSGRRRGSSGRLLRTPHTRHRERAAPVSHDRDPTELCHICSPPRWLELKHTHTQSHARTHTRTHARTRARTHTHTHTHTRQGGGWRVALLPSALLACWMDSTVWFMTPSSAATTRMTMSVALAPRALMEEKAAWPGVSRKVIFSPVGSWTGSRTPRSCFLLLINNQQVVWIKFFNVYPERLRCAGWFLRPPSTRPDSSSDCPAVWSYRGPRDPWWWPQGGVTPDWTGLLEVWWYHRSKVREEWMGGTETKCQFLQRNVFSSQTSTGMFG